MNYYPFHIGDYLSATRHLSWEEDAAYRRLLDVYYTTEKPLPLDARAVCRLVLATTESQREAVAVVLDEFFVETPEGWRSDRADREIAAMLEKQKKQRDKANKRWQKPEAEAGSASAMPRHEKTDAAASKPDAGAMPPTPTPTPTPKINTDSGAAQSAAPPPPFDGENAEVLNGKSIVPLAAGWELPEAWGVDAEALGFRPSDVIREAEKFRQYWTAGKGSGSRKSVRGWRQSWSNWLGKAAQRQ